MLRPEDIAEIETQYSGFSQNRLDINWGWMLARLAKRYDITKFTNPVPDAALGWLVALTDLDLYIRRGFNPSSEQDGLIEKASDSAKAEVKEAADSKDGLFDLPLRQDLQGQSGLVGQAPLAQGYASPYSWIDDQACVLNGGGR